MRQNSSNNWRHTGLSFNQPLIVGISSVFRGTILLRGLLRKHADATGLSKKLQCVNGNKEIKMSTNH